MLTVSVLFGEFSRHREPSLISIDDEGSAPLRRQKSLTKAVVKHGTAGRKGKQMKRPFILSLAMRVGACVRGLAALRAPLAPRRPAQPP